MNGRLLLDTNMVVALFAGENLVQERLAQADEVFLSSTVLGELYYGAQRSGRIEENRTRWMNWRPALQFWCAIRIRHVSTV